MDGFGIRQRLPAARLAIMPQVLSRLLDACAADPAGSADLAAIISLDAGLAARVIGVASAAQTDAPGPLSNLALCVAAAGPEVVKAIAIRESTARVFGRSSSAQEVALAWNWFHSLKCALLARTLAAEMDYPDPGEAYLAGLLHDIGALALAALDPGGYPQLLYQSCDDENLCRLELERYQATHAEVGTWLTEKWQLGSFLSDSILYHHVPAERVATAHPLIRIVLLANHLAQVEVASDLGGARELARLCGAPADSVAPALDRANADLARIAAELGVEREVAGAGPKPAVGLPALPSRALGELEAKLEKKLLIDGARHLLAGAGDVDAVLKAIAQAVLVLFGLQPAVFFLRDGGSQAYAGKALWPRHAKADQLRFFAGQSDSAAALATAGTPVIWFDRDSWRKPLDSQLARLLGGAGVVCIPIGAGAQCRGLVVAALNSQCHADLLQGKMELLRAFGSLADTMLGAAGGAAPPGAAPVPAAAGASREQIQHLLHEVSTPLTIVGNYLATLKISLGQNAIGEKELRIVAEEIDRVTQILDDFRQTPRSPSIAAGPIELKNLVQGLLDLCTGSGLVPPMVRIETNIHATAPAVIPNPDPLKQVLLNLMKNAFEAMPGGGVFRLSTSRWSDGGHDNHVEIMLEDSGPGLPEEVRRNMYQPVTSTKGGQHFGIGLSIAGQLVRDMNGLIHCHSDQNGCRFRIILPLGTQ